MLRACDVRYTANAVSPGVIYSSSGLDPPYYFEGDPMAVQYLYAMAAWSEGLQLTLTGSVSSKALPGHLFRRPGSIHNLTGTILRASPCPCPCTRLACS